MSVKSTQSIDYPKELMKTGVERIKEQFESDVLYFRFPPRGEDSRKIVYHETK